MPWARDREIVLTSRSISLGTGIRLFFSVILSLIVAIDLICFLAVFVAPLLSLSASSAHGELAVNLGLVFASVSGVVVLVTVVVGVVHPDWRTRINCYQLACVGLLAAYVLFVIAYLWRVLRESV